ncbi:MAG: peptidoglycan bridge formation glycyltransferase FemA/FemB family protein [Anaerolineales bacterium]|nr:peptidoglycan bridge formation glycyltransferase FemA/FemB family protein [Anaerolineales bacterium]
MQENWNEILSELIDCHLLQTEEWGDSKRQNGWIPHYKTWKNVDGQIKAAAMILERSIGVPLLPIKIRMLYIPKGPIVSDWTDPVLVQEVVHDLEEFARSRKALVLTMDPEVLTGRGFPGGEDDKPVSTGLDLIENLKTQGWRSSPLQPQFRNTILIDLTEDEETMLARMKQKTRYNIRLAMKKGVTIRVGDESDFEMLSRMYAETAVRDGFAIRAQDYYLTIWEIFFKANMLKPLIAEVEGVPVAAIMLYIFANKAWYITGMSTTLHRNLMPAYLLQWEAMKISKKSGCITYDLWGAPNEFVDDDSMWGVYKFKEGLGGTIARHVGAWEIPLRLIPYFLYTSVLPRLLDLLRVFGKTRTKKSLD